MNKTRLYCGVYFIGFEIEKINDFYNNKYQRYLKEFFNTEKHLIGHEKVFLRRSLNTINDFLSAQIDFKMETICTIYKDYLETKIKFINDQPKQPEAVKLNDVKQPHPKHDPNLWNNDCFELFKYLYDCYYKNTKRQLTNIWFYLKENGNAKYNLKATKEQYEVFILENYQIKITNFDKAQTKWEDKEYNTINDHRINFEDTLKQIAENAKNT